MGEITLSKRAFFTITGFMNYSHKSYLYRNVLTKCMNSKGEKLEYKLSERAKYSNEIHYFLVADLPISYNMETGEVSPAYMETTHCINRARF